jgi:Amt family ammonium transporter
MAAWREQGYSLLPVAVNLSGKHLISPDLLPFITQLLQTHDIPGELLEIEITEGVLLQDIDRCIEVLNALKELNIKISVDDFGTGYSSLNYLKRLPLDVLKIDRSFVEESTSSQEDSQICFTIIKLAESLHLKTVAEGVESEAQFRMLLEKDCHMFQGYYFSKPVSAGEIAVLLSGQEGYRDIAV